MRLLALLLALTLGPALAHTEVTAVTPAARAVTLTFSEPVDLRFSTLKVVPLPAGSDPAALAGAVLARRNDVAGRADTAPRLTGTAARVSLPLRADLRPGAYLVAWRVLSDDGHPVHGHAVFRVR